MNTQQKIRAILKGSFPSGGIGPYLSSLDHSYSIDLATEQLMELVKEARREGYEECHRKWLWATRAEELSND